MKKVTLCSVMSIGFLTLVSLQPVFAGCTDTTRFCNPIQYSTLQAFLEAFVNGVIYILFPILILMIVYTGFLFVKAQGNPAKISEARTALMWTVIGGLIILGAVALAKAIETSVNTILTP